MGDHWKLTAQKMRPGEIQRLGRLTKQEKWNTPAPDAQSGEGTLPSKEVKVK